MQVVYSQVSQSVVYSILQVLLNHLQINKLKGNKKSVISIFANMHFLIKQLQVAITPNHDI